MSTYNNPKTKWYYPCIIGGRVKKKPDFRFWGRMYYGGKGEKKSDFRFGLLNALALSLKLSKGFLFSCGWPPKVRAMSCFDMEM